MRLVKFTDPALKWEKLKPKKSEIGVNKINKDRRCDQRIGYFNFTKLTLKLGKKTLPPRPKVPSSALRSKQPSLCRYKSSFLSSVPKSDRTRRNESCQLFYSADNTVPLLRHWFWCHRCSLLVPPNWEGMSRPSSQRSDMGSRMPVTSRPQHLQQRQWQPVMKGLWHPSLFIRQDCLPLLWKSAAGPTTVLEAPPHPSLSFSLSLSLFLSLSLVIGIPPVTTYTFVINVIEQSRRLAEEGVCLYSLYSKGDGAAPHADK